jgi:outer membrane receptor protein involved in Fe transport
MEPLKYLSVIGISVSVLGACGAQDSEPASDRGDGADRVRFRCTTAGVSQFNTDMEGGGKLGFTRAWLNATVSHAISPQMDLDAILSYEYDNYDFEGRGAFTGLNPWDQIHSFRLQPTISWECFNRCSLFAGPTLTLAGEEGSDYADAWTAGGVLGVKWRASEKFSAGLGVGVFSRIEDDVTAFPLVTFDWRFAEGWSLRSGEFDLGSNGGADVELAWQFRQRWEAAVGARYETRRFRLDADRPIKNGVGEETVVPVYVRLSWDCLHQLRASALAGVATLGELELENKNGGRISKKEFDPAPFLGLSLTLSL